MYPPGACALAMTAMTSSIWRSSSGSCVNAYVLAAPQSICSIAVAPIVAKKLSLDLPCSDSEVNKRGGIAGQFHNLFHGWQGDAPVGLPAFKPEAAAPANGIQINSLELGKWTCRCIHHAFAPSEQARCQQAKKCEAQHS